MSRESFEKEIDYHFKDQGLLTRALTHSSYANESKQKMECNERLEFLGDSVLSVVVAEYLYNKFHLDEGDLTKIRASMVCEQALHKFALKIHLGDELLLGKGEEKCGGRERSSILADAFEAVIAAVFLDGGFDAAKRYILKYVVESFGNNLDSFIDYKTKLQEVIQQNPEEELSYHVVSESGPDHNKMFEVEIHLNSNVIGRGKASSKKNAEQLAAKEALELMGEF